MTRPSGRRGGAGRRAARAPRPAPAALLAVAALTLPIAGCGGGNDEPATTGAETVERPAPPPSGWRTVRNGVAGLTVAVPPRWTAATKRGATLIRSDDRLVSITVAADRTKPGRELAPAQYARQTLESLPKFEGSIRPGTRRVPSSPLESARVEGSGTLSTSRRAQRITVAAFQQPGSVTLVAIVFRNAKVHPRFNDRRIDRLLRTVRTARRD